MTSGNDMKGDRVCRWVSPGQSQTGWGGPTCGHRAHAIPGGNVEWRVQHNERSPMSVGYAGGRTLLVFPRFCQILAAVASCQCAAPRESYRPINPPPIRALPTIHHLRTPILMLTLSKHAHVARGRIGPHPPRVPAHRVATGGPGDCRPLRRPAEPGSAARAAGKHSLQNRKGVVNNGCGPVRLPLTNLNVSRCGPALAGADDRLAGGYRHVR